MKKLLCITLTLIIMLSSFVAYANTDALVDAWLKDIKSANSKLDISFKLNRPLEFMNELTKNDVYSDETSNALIEGFVSSLLNSGASVDMASSISEDYKKIKASSEIQLNVPVEAGDSFKADLWAKFGFWMDIDITDETNPVLKYIFKIPFTDKYYVMDYVKMSDTDSASVDGFVQYMAKYTDAKFVDEFNSFFANLMKKHMTITNKGGGVYEVSADDKSFKAMLREGSAEFMKIFDDAMAVYGYETESDVDYKSEINNAFDVIDSIQILGTEGFKGTVTVKNGYVTLTDFALHICVNISDVAAALSQDMSLYDREKLWIDVTMYTKASYDNINKNVNVVFPKIDESNVVDVFEMYRYEDDYYDDEFYDNYISPWLYVAQEGTPVVVNDELYMPLRDSMLEFGVNPENIIVNSGEILVTADDIGILEFTEIKFNEFSNVVYINGQSVTLDNPVVERDGKAYFPKQLMEHLNCTVERFSYYIDEEIPCYDIQCYREWYGYDEY